MKRTTPRHSTLHVAAFALLLVISVGVFADLTVVSDNTWNVFTPIPTIQTGCFGEDFQRVCLNGHEPSQLRAGRFSSADALWIPRDRLERQRRRSSINRKMDVGSDITGATTPAQSQAFVFQKDDIYVCNPPQDSTISIASDDTAEVSVNVRSCLAQEHSSQHFHDLHGSCRLAFWFERKPANSTSEHGHDQGKQWPEPSGLLVKPVSVQSRRRYHLGLVQVRRRPKVPGLEAGRPSRWLWDGRVRKTVRLPQWTSRVHFPHLRAELGCHR